MTGGEVRPAQFLSASMSPLETKLMNNTILSCVIGSCYSEETEIIQHQQHVT